MGTSDHPFPEDNSPNNSNSAFQKISQLATIKLVATRWRTKAQSPTSPLAPQFQPPPPLAPVSVSRTLTLSRRKTREHVAREETISSISAFLGGLENLTDLKVHYRDSNEEESLGDNWSIHLLPSFGKGTPYASSLRNLTLSGSITTWKRVLKHWLDIEMLESLSVSADMGFRNPNDDTYAIRLELAPFIRRHSKTLKKLAFSSAMVVDLTSLYDGAGLLSRLESFEIEQPYLPPSRTHSDALNQFLIRHRDTLTSFKWTFVAPSDGNTQVFELNPQEWFEQPPYQLTLPSLQHLQFTFPSPSNSALFEGTLFYCARHTSTLTRLSLEGLTLTLPQFHELLLLVGSKQLQEFGISLEVLTSAVLINLSSKFPALKMLRLVYTSVGRQKAISEPSLVDPTGGGILKIPNVSVVRTWHFRQDMTVLVLSTWPVRELYLRRNVDRSWSDYRADQAGKLVLKSLPGVGFVNGMYREVFLQP